MTISEEDVCGVDLVTAAINFFSMRNIWPLVHVKTKDLIALVLEVLQINHVGANSMES